MRKKGSNFKVTFDLELIDEIQTEDQIEQLVFNRISEVAAALNIVAELDEKKVTCRPSYRERSE